MPDDRATTYSSYLALDELLAAQRPRSEEHDELLFIVIHQVYELWFKQILHEAGRLQERLEAGDTTHALHTLTRILTILKTLVAQIDVLETMTPRQFTAFRARLDAASGFQSKQFRQIEALLDGPLYASFERYLEQHGHDKDDLLRVYREDGSAVLVAEKLVDLDEGVMEWRYRHVQMVRRTIGDKTGTGGSSGAKYLESTLLKPAFPALWAVRGEL